MKKPTMKAIRGKDLTKKQLLEFIGQLSTKVCKLTKELDMVTDHAVRSAIQLEKFQEEISNLKAVNTRLQELNLSNRIKSENDQAEIQKNNDTVVKTLTEKIQDLEFQLESNKKMEKLGKLSGYIGQDLASGPGCAKVLISEIHDPKKF